MSKAKSPEVAERKAARERKERRKTAWLLAGVILVMIGAIAADVFFIQWQRHQRHLRHEQRLNLSNHPGNTNQLRSETSIPLLPSFTPESASRKQ